MYLNKTALVVSPLIALMEDQVLALELANIPACLLGSAMQKEASTYDRIRGGHYRYACHKKTASFNQPYFIL